MTYKILTYGRGAQRTSNLHSTQTPDDWRSKAACRGQAGALDVPDNFTVADRVQVKINAERLCTNCPVKTECYDTADQDDMKHTVRGGRIPLSMQGTYHRGRPPVYNEAEIALLEKYISSGSCRKGHDLKSIDDAHLKPTAGGKVHASCRFCRAVQSKKYQQSGKRVRKIRRGTIKV